MESDDLLRIKAATRDLVALVGGPVRAATLGRGTASRFTEYGQPSNMDRFIAADMIAVLERECGVPVVTVALAALSGFDLERRQAGPPREMHRALAEITTQCAEAQSAIAEGLADGSLNANEKRQVVREAQEAVDALQRLIAQLQ